MKNRSLDPLRSAGFLLALFLLLLNDHLLKEMFGSWWTGKLSDVAGLFAFTIFWLALLPRRPLLVGMGVGLLFTFWKLPFSDVLIDGWNGLGILPVGRVVDPTDLIALCVVPAALFYAERSRPLNLGRLTVVPVILIAFFAFVATSCLNGWDYNEEYHFNISRNLLVDSLTSLEETPLVLSVEGGATDADVFWISIKDTSAVGSGGAFPYDGIQQANVELMDRGEGITIRLHAVRDRRTDCQSMGCFSKRRVDPNDPRRRNALRNFEENVINVLRRKFS